MSDTRIVFSALVLPDVLKREIILSRDKILNERGISQAGFEREEKLHITLRYFGEVSETSLNSIIKATGQIADMQPFEILLTGYSVIYRKKIPRVLYANIKMPVHAFELVKKLDFQYQQIGYETDSLKPFLPHITVKRIRMNGDESLIQYFPEKFDNPKSFLIDTLAIYESIRTRTGSTYKLLKTYKLEGSCSQKKNLN